MTTAESDASAGDCYVTAHPPFTPYEGTHLARKPNYDFEKRMKESARKAKKDAKRTERLQRKSDARADNAGGDADGEASSDEDGEDTGDQEPDSQ